MIFKKTIPFVIYLSITLAFPCFISCTLSEHEPGSVSGYDPNYDNGLANDDLYYEDSYSDDNGYYDPYSYNNVSSSSLYYEPYIPLSSSSVNISSASNVFFDSRDGNSYTYKQIGSYVWMMENLRYDNGNSLCYDNNFSNCSRYGSMYTGPDAQSVCPKPWRLPGDEYQNLTEYIMKATGVSSQWDSKVVDWLESSNGFNMKLGGAKIPQDFRGINERGYYWTSNYGYDGYYHYGILYYSLDRSSDSDDGYYNYVRCVTNP